MGIKLKRVIPALNRIKDIEKLSLDAHAASSGAVELVGRVKIKSLEDLAVYYTPGVAYVSKAIRANKDLSYKYTSRGNRIAIISDGSRILGLGDIGPEAGIPVMEGKALLFKKFGNVDALPIAIRAKSAEEIVAFARAIEPSVAGINLEDISSPNSFVVFEMLQKELSIPVYHDDRQGTAVVALAALTNALKLVGKSVKSARIVINGVGSAGVGIAQLLISEGATNIIMCDTRGILYKGRKDNMNPMKESLATHTNRGLLKGQLQDAARGADVLIGVSSRGAFTDGMIKSMKKNPIVFALANPDPEISYEKAIAAGAAVVATGESDVPNQVNNLLAFPAILRGALDVHARKINTAMLLAAAATMAESIPKNRLKSDHIIPNFVADNFSEMTANVAVAVAKAAMSTGVARVKKDPSAIRQAVKAALKRYSRLEADIAKLNKKGIITRLLKRHE